MRLAKSFYILILLGILCRGGFAQIQDSIRIGEFASITGQTATFGQSCHLGILLAVEKANASGGVLGKYIKLITEDDQSKPEDALSAVHKLFYIDHVSALLGEVASSRSRAAAPFVQLEKIPMISPASTNPEVTKIGDYIFRTCFIDPFQGTAMAGFAKKTLHAKRAAILVDIRQDYCITVAQAFEKSFTKFGGNISSELSYSTDDKDFKSALTAIDSSHPDVIFVPGYYTDVALIVKQARNMGITIPILGADGWDSPELTLGAEKEFNNTYFSNHFSIEEPNPVVKKFVTDFKHRFNQEPNQMSALGYDAANILLNSIKRAGSTDSKKLRNAIANTKKFNCVTGTITIDKERNASKSLVVLQIVNGLNKYEERIGADGNPIGK